MFAETEEVDVFHDHHLVVFNWKERPVQQVVDVLLIALGHEGESFCHSLWGIHESVAAWLLPESEQHLVHQGFDEGEIGGPSLSTHLLHLLPASPCHRQFSHAIPL